MPHLESEGAHSSFQNDTAPAVKLRFISSQHWGIFYLPTRGILRWISMGNFTLSPSSQFRRISHITPRHLDDRRQLKVRVWLKLNLLMSPYKFPASYCCICYCKLTFGLSFPNLFTPNVHYIKNLSVISPNVHILNNVIEVYHNFGYTVGGRWYVQRAYRNPFKVRLRIASDRVGLSKNGV